MTAASAPRLRPAAVSASPAAVPASAPQIADVPAPRRLGVEPASGPYLGGAQGETRHRISFTVLNGSVRNLRVDGLGMAQRAPIRDGAVETHHVGFGLDANWIDQRTVEGTVKMRGRWGRNQTFRFRARHRHLDVLSGG